MSQYRQPIPPEIDESEQARLAAARILCIGAGAAGRAALQYLAGAGPGALGIVDSGMAGEADFEGQILLRTEDAGKPRAQAVRARLKTLNPDLEIRAYNEALHAGNAPGLISGYDIIIDAAGECAVAALINDYAVRLGKPVVYGGMRYSEGQVAVFDAGSGPCYRCFQPAPHEEAHPGEAGANHMLASIIGTMQAVEAIRLVVNRSAFEPLTGRLWTIDARTMETRTRDIPKRDDCPLCARPAATITPQYFSPVCAAAHVTEISCDDPRMENAALMDVRELPEWEEGRMPGARHLPLSVITKDPRAFVPPEGGKDCVLYCQKGIRSRKAAEILLREGFTDLYSLQGGYEAWRARQRR